jgi:hypothetical protein
VVEQAVDAEARQVQVEVLAPAALRHSLAAAARAVAALYG